MDKIKRSLLFLISFYSLCSCKQSNNSNELVRFLYLGLIASASYYECLPNELDRSKIDFLDLSSDVKAGFPNFVNEQSFQDIVKGSFEITDSFISGSLILQGIPESLPLNKLQKTSLEIPEFKLIYNFIVSDQTYGIGIFHFSDQTGKGINSNKLPIDVYKNNKYLATCGFFEKNENTLEFSCDKSVITDLNKIRIGSKWNSYAVFNEGSTNYKDCY